jgi:hypothetical protein
MAIVVALATAIAYGIGMPLPHLAPILAITLTSEPAPPPGLKGLLGLLVAVAATLSTGLIMIPLLLNYPFPAVLIILLGLYTSTIISIRLDQKPVGVLFAIGLTMIPAAGMVDHSLGVTVIEGLLSAVTIAIVCQWLVYPWLPENPGKIPAKTPITMDQARWLALRATLIVLPPVLLAFTNPSLYLATILKCLALGQQGTEISAREAGRELLGSTALAGCLSILFWFALQTSPTLWFFTLWMLLFSGYGAAKLYQVIPGRFTPSFWQNTLVTMLILLGPAVQDSANGKDVYQAFAMRLGLLIAVTLYAWLAIAALDWVRTRTKPRPILLPII